MGFRRRDAPTDPPRWQGLVPPVPAGGPLQGTLMADIEHRVLTGADLHEPKGIAAAAVGLVYVSDGAGSGSWTSVPTDNSVGEIYSPTTDAINITVAGSYVRWSPATGVANAVQNITVLATSGTFTCTVAGTYRVSFHGTVVESTDETEPVDLKFRLAGAVQEPGLRVQPAYIDDPAPFHLSKLLVLAVGQTVDVAATTPNNTNNVNVTNGVLQIEKVA